MSEVVWEVYESPIGLLTLVGGEAGLRALRFGGKVPLPPESARGRLPAVVAQLEACFGGELRAFDLGLDLRGAPLDVAVWRRLLDIPYGATESYGALAARVDPGLVDPPDVTPLTHGPRRLSPSG